MKVLLYLFLIISVAALNCNAQIVQKERYEFTLSSQEESFFTQSAGVEGLIIFKQNPSKSTSEYNVWLIIHLDTLLQEKSFSEMKIDSEYSYKGASYSDNKLLILFQQNKTQLEKLAFITYQIKKRELQLIKYDNLLPLKISHFDFKQDNLVLGGNFKLEVVVKSLNINNGQTNVLPGFSNKEGELISLRFDKSTPNLKVTTKEKQPDKSLDLINRLFSKEGKQIKYNQIGIDSNLKLIDGMFVNTEGKDEVAAGLYSSGISSIISNGLFFTNLKKNNSRYLALTELDNFFNYKGQKRASRFKNKIARKRKRGKVLDFSYNLKANSLFHWNGENIILLEAYIPNRHAVSYQRNGIKKQSEESNYAFASLYSINPILPFDNGRSFHGFLFKQAVLVSLADNGDLLWDDTINLQPLYDMQLKEQVMLAQNKDYLTLLYLLDNQIHYKNFEGTSEYSKENLRLKLLHPEDILTKNIYYLENLQRWHDNTFFAYGVNIVSNKNLADKKNRVVFFINKIVVE